MSRWVLASSNAGKLKEFQHALGPVLSRWHVSLVSQSDLAIDSPEEPFLTFEENALAKARHASAASGLPAIADDSGLCVDALGGRPGVRSARYWRDAADSSDPHLRQQLDALPTDEANLVWLLKEIERERLARFGQGPVAPEFWNAQFHAAIAFVRFADDQHAVVVSGIWPGRLITTPCGKGGFGYDPIFFDDTLGCTAADMSLAQKQSVSHRGRALEKLLSVLSAC